VSSDTGTPEDVQQVQDFNEGKQKRQADTLRATSSDVQEMTNV
jgi:hypothetical protein